MTGKGPLERQTVVVDADRIVAIGPSNDVVVPDNARIVEAAGKFLIPGLFDMHVHLSKIGETALPLFTANGVSSVRDMGSDFDEVSMWRGEIEAGARVGPRIKTPGPIFESATSVQRMKNERVVEPVERTRVPVPDAESAPRIVEALAARRVDFIKIRTFASKDVYFAVAETAKRLGLPLVGHADHLTSDDLFRAGHLSVEHAPLPRFVATTDEERKALFERFKSRGIVFVPTLVNATESFLVPADRAEAIVNDPEGRIDFRRKYVSEHLLADWREQVGERRGPIPDALRRLFEDAQRKLRELHEAGVRILPGTDAAVLLNYPGFMLHIELQRFVELLGMTPEEALLSATRYSAEFLGVDDEVGTIEVGKRADLVLLDANPLEEISRTNHINAVVSRGRFYDKQGIEELLKGVEEAVKQ